MATPKSHNFQSRCADMKRVSYTIICRTKLNWPVDASMRLEFDITTGAKSEIETLERKRQHVYTDKNGVGASSYDACYWDREGLTGHCRVDHSECNIMTSEKHETDGTPKKNKGGKINAKDRPAIKAHYIQLIKIKVSQRKMDMDLEKKAWDRHSHPKNIDDILRESPAEDEEIGAPLLPLRNRRETDAFPKRYDFGDGRTSDKWVPAKSAIFAITSLLKMRTGKDKACKFCMGNKTANSKKKKLPGGLEVERQ